MSEIDAIIRSQQDQDTPQHIAEDETVPLDERRDSDDASGRDRQACARGEKQSGSDQTSVLRSSRSALAAGAAIATTPSQEDTQSGRTGSLIQPGRSILGH
ncbi:hypothetical protein [Consotaella aegiceratis]|uniref:hypothetical protein n=1 Tax=Consotaella aegiceratis TaxID=3097961 RepID=UPI002F3F68AD